MARFISKIDTASPLVKAVESSETAAVEAFSKQPKVARVIELARKAVDKGQSFSKDVSFTDPSGVEWNVEIGWNFDRRKAYLSAAGFDEEGMEWDTGTIENDAIKSKLVHGINGPDKEALSNINTGKVKQFLSTLRKAEKVFKQAGEDLTSVRVLRTLSGKLTSMTHISNAGDTNERKKQEALTKEISKVFKTITPPKDKQAAGVYKALKKEVEDVRYLGKMR